LLANAQTKLILSQRSQYSERENRIRQQYHNEAALPFRWTLRSASENMQANGPISYCEVKEMTEKHRGASHAR